MKKKVKRKGWRLHFLLRLLLVLIFLAGTAAVVFGSALVLSLDAAPVTVTDVSSSGVNYEFHAEGVLETGYSPLPEDGNLVAVYLRPLPEVNSLASHSFVQQISALRTAGGRTTLAVLAASGLFLSYGCLFLAFPSLPFFGLGGRTIPKGRKYSYDMEFFCWNCGRRIHRGEKLCPRCGVPYMGKNYLDSPRRTPTEGSSCFHPSILRYVLQCWLAFLVWDTVWCAGVWLIMYVTGDDLDYFGIILAVVFGAGFLFTLAVTLRLPFRCHKIRGLNRLAPDDDLRCAACGYPVNRLENFCPRCGCQVQK